MPEQPVYCDQCGTKLCVQDEHGILHFDHRLRHGQRFQMMSPITDESKVKCINPYCPKWTGIWEMTTTGKVEFISERY